jgi:hypothetical protein
LAATRNSTSLLPCPEIGDNPEIQLTALDAVQAHSGCVDTANLPAPPPASTIGGAANVTWHLTGSGPLGVVVMVEDVLQPAVSAAAIRPIAVPSNEQRFTRTRFVASLRIIADFRRSLANRVPALPSSKSYSREVRCRSVVWLTAIRV